MFYCLYLPKVDNILVTIFVGTNALCCSLQTQQFTESIPTKMSDY